MPRSAPTNHPPTSLPPSLHHCRGGTEAARRRRGRRCEGRRIWKRPASCENRQSRLSQLNNHELNNQCRQSVSTVKYPVIVDNHHAMNSSVPLRRSLGATMPPGAATAGLGYSCLIAVLPHTGTLGACDKTTLQLRRLCVQCGIESGFEPIKTVPDPVRGSSLDQATRPKGASHRHPPSWLSPAHSPG